MYDLVDYLIGSFVEKDQYELMMVEDGDKVEIKVLIDSDVINTVIGKGGKIAKAIRTIVKGAGQKFEENYSIYIEER